MVREDDTYVIHGPVPSKPLPTISLGKIIYESLLANPNKHPAMVDAVSDESTSYRELLQLTCSLAESLRRDGCGKNTIVSVSSENNLQFFIPVISCLYVGATVAPINPVYTEQELLHTLNISKPTIIFCSKLVTAKYVHLKNTKLSFIDKIITIDTDEAIHGAETLNGFMQKHLKGHPSLTRFAVEEIDPNKEIAFIMCSSGTTGLPKGVMQTHTSWLVRYMQTIDPRYTNPTDNFLGFLPFFHGFGLVTTFFALVVGQKVVVMAKFEEEVFLKAIQDHRISVLFLAPPIMVLLSKSNLVSKYDLSSVTEVICGAAPLGKETENIVKKRLNIPYISQAWGLTEVTLGVTYVEVGDYKAGSSGKVATYMSCKIRDPETGESLGPGKIGEICVKGPLVTPGYYRNVEATRNTFTSDGWLLTGDLGYYDEEGFFFIVDRLKELIKYKGFQVAPAELEAVILSYPKVKDVGVVGLPDEEAGELPIAFVTKHENVNLTEEEIIDFVAGKLSPYKRLRGGVIFVPVVPKSPSGKILRRELRKMLTTYKAKL